MLPEDDGAKWFAIFYAIIGFYLREIFQSFNLLIQGTIIMGKALGDIAQFPLVWRSKKAEMAVVAQYGTDLDQVFEFCENDDSFFTWFAF